MKAEFQEILDSVSAVEKRILSTIHLRFDSVDARLGAVERKVSSLETTLLDVRDDLEGGLKAIDKHALKLIDHDKRIGRLEKRMA